MEYTLGATTLRYGWDPARDLAHNQLIRLTLAHPMTKLVTRLDLDLVLRLGHPISVAAIPVSIFIISREFFSDRVSISSSILYIFLHPFFFRLSRDTRTGGAILLFSLFVFCLWRIYRAQSNKFQYLIAAIPLAIGTIGSHEGITIMGLGMLSVAVVFIIIWTRNLSIPILVTLVGITAYIWYSDLSGGSMFTTIVYVLWEAIIGILGSGGESKAGAAASASLQSFTYKFIRTSIICIFGIAGLNYLYQFWRSYIEKNFPLPYLGFLGGGFGVLAAAFAPIAIIGIVRPVALVGVFVLPLFLQVLLNRISISTDTLSVLFCGLLLINAGVAGVYLDERTPQPNLQRGDIEKVEGIDYFHLRSTYTTDAEIRGSRWLYQNADSKKRIYAPTGAGSIVPQRISHPNDNKFGFVDLGCEIGESDYIYLNAYATHTGSLALRSPSYFSAIHTETEFTQRSVVYSNGDSTVGLTQGNEHIC